MLFYNLDRKPIQKSYAYAGGIDYTIISFINTFWDTDTREEGVFLVDTKIESLNIFEYLHLTTPEKQEKDIFFDYLKDLKGCVFYKCLFDSKDSKTFKILNENNVVMFPFFLNEKHSYENVTTFYEDFQSASYFNLKLFNVDGNLKNFVIHKGSKLSFFESRFSHLNVINRNHINFETEPSQEKFDGCKFTACNFSRFTNATSHFENSIFDRCAFSLDTFNTPKVVEIFLSKGRKFKPFVYERVKEFAKELKIENCVFEDIKIYSEKNKYKIGNPDWSEQVKTIFLFNDEIDLSTCKFALNYPSPEKANLIGKDYNSTRLWKKVDGETFTSMSDFIEKTHGWVWSMLSKKHFEECNLNSGIALTVDARIFLTDCTFENCIVSFVELPSCKNVVFKDCTFEHPRELKKVITPNRYPQSDYEGKLLTFKACTFKNAVDFSYITKSRLPTTINDCVFEDFYVADRIIVKPFAHDDDGIAYRFIFFPTVLNRCHFETGFKFPSLKTAFKEPFFWDKSMKYHRSIKHHKVLKDCTFGKNLIVEFKEETLEGEEAIKFIKDCFVIQD